MALVALGVVMVYSSSVAKAARDFNDPQHFLTRQLIWVSLGLIAMLIASLLDSAQVKKLAWPLFTVTLITLLLVLIPGIGKEANGARRWINFGSFGFQPSEFAKLSLVLYLSFLLGKRADNKDEKPGLLPVFVIAHVPVVLVLAERDFGTAVLMEIFIIALLVSAGLKWRYLVVLLMALVPIAYILIIRKDYRLKRVLAWLDPWSFRQDLGYQTVQSLISMGSGGVFGLGLGESKQKLFFLPENHTDFILSIVGEELGLIGLLFIVLAFVSFGVIGLRIAFKLQDNFAKYLAFGITFMIVTTAVTNICVVTGVLPNKGLTLPFISYGGSNLIVSLAATGLLLSLARQAEEA